jgi:alkanesulfonate monooxygenase SsuD/methylene tetrahydromethanopterin reductase-like flavin-dependent oxidoreductase (luciferase family)
MPIDLGIALPHYDYSFAEPPAPGLATVDRVIEAARRAEALGFDQAWMSDHFWLDLGRYGGPPGRYGTPECLTTLAALSQRTSTIRIGSLVLANGFRYPTVLAKTLATLDQLADGRLDVGIGAAWGAEEFTENGLDFPPPGERVARLEEALGILRALLGGDGSFEGRFYRADGAPVIPGPVQRPWPPLWVGGKGDRLLGVVARAADGWNLCWQVDEERYAERSAVLDAACRRAGRDPAGVRRSLGLNTLLGRDADDLVERWRRLVCWAPGGVLDGVELRDWAAGRLVGTPDEVLAQLRRWEAAGISQVISTFGHLPFVLPDPEQLDLMAELVIARLR